MIADIIALILIIAAAIPATFGPLVYLRRPWRSTEAGKAVMQLWVGMALLIDISLLYRWLGDDYPLRDLVRLTVYAWIAYSLWRLFLAMLRARE